MRRFIARHLDKIIGVLEGFDRLVFRGWSSAAGSSRSATKEACGDSSPAKTCC